MRGIGAASMEPVSTTGTLAKILGTIKDFPLWLLSAVAISLTVFALVPKFSHLASQDTNNLVLYGVFVAWIFVAARSVQLAFEAVRSYRNHREARHRFYVTPIEHHCYWSVSAQPDGSNVTQISAQFMVKNRSAEPLHLMKARVVRPKIPGEILPGLLATRSAVGNDYGTPAVSENFIAPGHTLPVVATILIRGVPKQKNGTIPATIKISDADGHAEIVKIQLPRVGGAGPHSPALVSQPVRFKG